MRYILWITVVLISGGANANNVTIEHKIIELASNWKEESKRLTEYVGLSGFCMDGDYRNVVYGLLNEIHSYHAILYQGLLETSNHHDQKKMHEVLDEIEKIEGNYNMESFNDFFRERCYAQADLEKRLNHYKAGFGVHSYYGKIYVMEEELNRYLKKFSKSIIKVKKHLKHLHMEKVADHLAIDLN